MFWFAIRFTQAKTPATLPDTTPIELQTVSAKVLDNAWEDIWYVSKQYYMLTSVTMYKSKTVSSGFNITFEPYPSSEFSDWPPETHFFGTTYLQS